MLKRSNKIECWHPVVVIGYKICSESNWKVCTYVSRSCIFNRTTHLGWLTPCIRFKKSSHTSNIDFHQMLFVLPCVLFHNRTSIKPNVHVVSQYSFGSMLSGQFFTYLWYHSIRSFDIELWPYRSPLSAWLTRKTRNWQDFAALMKWTSNPCINISFQAVHEFTFFCNLLTISWLFFTRRFQLWRRMPKH